ncbi:vitamin K epoxide reductase family protein [Streptomyces sp. BI20]|uniref:vitamin K epoxide reductase family protein n=1 Tax=Streptomyces sp. BI20 TaxID=3403460 RepID=UPI003C7388D6
MATNTVGLPRQQGSGAGPRPGAAPAPSRPMAWLLILTGAAGLLASWVITLDKFLLLEDPDFKPACSLNPVVSCGSVMQSEQAAAFGFPNPMLGLVAYGVVVCVGAGLLAGAAYRPWFWLGLNAGTLFGTGFCAWLMTQSLYEINALCLWCCLAWVATLAMFWGVTAHNVRSGALPAPGPVRTAFVEAPWVFPVIHTGVIGMLVLTRWWEFWTS